MPYEEAPWLHTLVLVLNRISCFGVGIPLALGLWRWQRLSAAERAVVWYFAYWFVEAFVDLWSRWVLHNNRYLYHVNVLVETWLLGWAYYRAFESARLRGYMLPAGLVFTGVCLLDALVWSGLWELNNVARVTQVVVLLLLIFLYFEQWLRRVRQDSPWHDIMFVVSVTQLFYLTISLTPYLNITGAVALDQVVASVLIDGTYIIIILIISIVFARQGRPGKASNEPLYSLGSLLR